MPPSRPKPKIPGVETVSRRRRDGSTYFEYRVRWTDPLTGKRLGEYFNTPGEALDFKADLRRARRRGQLGDMDRGRDLLAEFAMRWLQEWASANLTKRTLRNYAGAFNNHLLSRVGHLQLRQITPRVVDQLRTDLQADGVGDPMILKALTVLQAILRQAVVWGEVTANPVKEVSKPSRRRTRVIAPLTVPQVEALLDHLGERSRAGRMLAALVAYSGARPQDALALPWTSVGTRRLVYAAKNVDGLIVPGAKTGADKSRSVTMLQALRDDLELFRAEQPRGAELVIALPDGTPWREHDYKNWTVKQARGRPKGDGSRAGSPGAFARAAAAIGLPGITPYFLRHTYASLRIAEQRLSLAEIAGEMGHSIEVLSGTYAHVITEYAGQGPVDPDALIARVRHQEATE